MVVQIDACRFTPAAIPLEDESPLLVDADRMEAFKIAAQLFEMITGILIMSALEKSGPAFLVPGRANRDPKATSARLAVSLAVKLERGYAARLAFGLNQRIKDVGIACVRGGASPAPSVWRSNRARGLVAAN